MRKLDSLLERADEGLRSLLLGRDLLGRNLLGGNLLGGKLPAWLLAVFTFAAFYGLMMTRTLTQLAGASAASHAWGVLVLCLPLGVMLLFALRLT